MKIEHWLALRRYHMSLQFDERRLLHPGIHDALLEDLDEQFARFQKSDRRMKLFAGLRSYVSDLKNAGLKCALIINGSFVMPAVDEPEDIDLILVLPKDWDMAADLKPYQYNLVSKKRVRKQYGFDVFPVRSGSDEEEEWIAFFSQVNMKWCHPLGWPRNTQKGLVRLLL